MASRALETSRRHGGGGEPTGLNLLGLYEIDSVDLKRYKTDRHGRQVPEQWYTAWCRQRCRRMLAPYGGPELTVSAH